MLYTYIYIYTSMYYTYIHIYIYIYIYIRRHQTCHFRKRAILRLQRDLNCVLRVAPRAVAQAARRALGGFERFCH